MVEDVGSDRASGGSQRVKSGVSAHERFAGGRRLHGEAPEGIGGLLPRGVEVVVEPYGEPLLSVVVAAQDGASLVTAQVVREMPAGPARLVSMADVREVDAAMRRQLVVVMSSRSLIASSATSPCMLRIVWGRRSRSWAIGPVGRSRGQTIHSRVRACLVVSASCRSAA